MGLEKIRRRANFAGPITIGADAGLRRLGANVIGPISGDTLAVDSGTAAVGTAGFNAVGGTVAGALMLRQLGAGTPCIAFRNSSGTVYAMHFLAAGGAVTGTPITA